MSVSGLPDGLLLRPFRDSDLPYVRDTWARGAANVFPWSVLGSGVVHQRLRPAIDRLMAAGNTIVCHTEDDPDTIAGYVCHSGDVLHWVHVKRVLQGVGVCRALLAEAFGGRPPKSYTFPSVLSADLLAAKTETFGAPLYDPVFVNRVWRDASEASENRL